MPDSAPGARALAQSLSTPRVACGYAVPVSCRIQFGSGTWEQLNRCAVLTSQQPSAGLEGSDALYLYCIELSHLCAHSMRGFAGLHCGLVTHCLLHLNRLNPAEIGRAAQCLGGLVCLHSSSLPQSLTRRRHPLRCSRVSGCAYATGCLDFLQEAGTIG